MINKKKALINFLVSNTASDTSRTDLSASNLANSIVASGTKIINDLSNRMSSTLNDLAEKFTGSRLSSSEDSSSSNIPTSENSKSYGDYMPDKFILNQLSLNYLNLLNLLINLQLILILKNIMNTIVKD